MKALYPLLALLLMGATGPCGTAVRSSAGSYGYLGGGFGPAPSENVTSDGNVVTVDQAMGDRMFTVITTRYDAKTLTLLSSKLRASCCGSYWNSSVTRNADGSYDVEAQMTSGEDVYKESRTRMHVAANEPINIGGLFFLPFMYHATQAAEILQVDFSPIMTGYLRVQQTAAAPYPANVPAHDKALIVTSMRTRRSAILWYDPCTFALDAYGTRDGRVEVRTAVL
ncbi:MAG TPA: hypothetical protein VFN37_13440 [Candidatus Baltobacteraceae bacterium]|nr:hypothetical protein [Candidatus Baltobacteraceae bacterium]